MLFNPQPKPIKQDKKKPKGIKKFSSTRMVMNDKYAKVRIEYLSEYRVCEVKGCMHASSQIHHKAGRIGVLLIDTKYFLAVCEYCHAEIESKPAWAKQEGYSVTRTNK